MKLNPKWLLWLCLLFFALAAAFFTLRINQKPSVEPTWGATFSARYARELGADPHAAFVAALDELRIRSFRIPVYWDELEPVQDEFRFEEIDWMLQEASKRGAKVTLAIGQKVPRWPECFPPQWLKSLDDASREEALTNMLSTIVTRYRNHAAIERWQIENEPFFPFGDCPEPNRDLFNREVALVRSLDDRPIMTTVSGETDPWIDAASFVDVLGISLYRVSWNSVYGYASYPFPPSYYQARASSVSPLVNHVIISELQAEPWLPKPLNELSVEERSNLFTRNDLRNQVEFARRTGLSEVSLWGVEWWYAEREQGNAELWDEARNLFTE